MFGLFKRNSRHRDAALDLYSAVVRQARQARLYTGYGVPDTPDGRYDMIMVHAFLLLQRLKRDHDRTQDLGQAFFDLMFDDMDQNLREMGAGDIGVSHRIKDMAKAFYGRIAAYEDGMRRGDEALAAAVARNVYRNGDPAPGCIDGLAAYMRAQAAALAAQSTDDLSAGRVAFDEPSD